MRGRAWLLGLAVAAGTSLMGGTDAAAEPGLKPGELKSIHLDTIAAKTPSERDALLERISHADDAALVTLRLRLDDEIKSFSIGPPFNSTEIDEMKKQLEDASLSQTERAAVKTSLACWQKEYARQLTLTAAGQCAFAVVLATRRARRSGESIDRSKWKEECEKASKEGYYEILKADQEAEPFEWGTPAVQARRQAAGPKSFKPNATKCLYVPKQAKVSAPQPAHGVQALPPGAPTQDAWKVRQEYEERRRAAEREQLEREKKRMESGRAPRGP